LCVGGARGAGGGGGGAAAAFGEEGLERARADPGYYCLGARTRAGSTAGAVDEVLDHIN